MEYFKFNDDTLLEIQQLTKNKKLLWNLYKYKQSDVFDTFFYDPVIHNDSREVWFTDFINKQGKIARLYLFKMTEEKEYSIAINFLKIHRWLFFLRMFFFNHIEIDREGKTFAVMKTDKLVNTIIEEIK